MLDMHHDFMRVGECKLSCVKSSRGARNLEGHIMQTVMHHATIFRDSVKLCFRICLLKGDSADISMAGTNYITRLKWGNAQLAGLVTVCRI